MRILIVKTSSLGDILHAFPILDALPSAQIDWVVERPFAELVSRHPLVHQTLTVDTKQWRKGRSLKGFAEFCRTLRHTPYDWVFDLQGNCKSALFTLLARSKNKVGFGKETVPEWPNLLATKTRYNPPPGRNIRQDYLYLVSQALGIPDELPQRTTPLTVTAKERSQVDKLLAHPKLQQKRILVCPGSAWPNKRLPLPALVTFCSRIDGGLIWLWGNDEERGLAHQLHQQFGTRSVVAPKLSLPALQHLMGQVDRIITMDSLPLHLAGLTSTHTTSFFGPSLAAKYAPLGDHHTPLQGTCPYNQTFTKRCPKLRSCPTGACMDSLV
ncbi:MAG: glycosyltransferase family 9 protein [Parachlamydiales bacterium]